MITVHIGLLLILPLIGILAVIGLIEGYAKITLLKLQHEIKKAEEYLRKCEKDLEEISKNYTEKQSEIKAALEAYEELLNLMGMKK